MESASQQPSADLPPSLTAVEAELGRSLEGIRQGFHTTHRLRERLGEGLGEWDEPDCAVVVTGSLGRCEASDNSDADSILLVDGPSNPDHARLARQVDAAVTDAGFKEVGATKTFGVIVASHDLVHYIAGTRDTNENLTRRMLLLAESHAIAGRLVRQRVVRNVLARYVETDRSVRNFLPISHFLLNDVVRYWRTIASDYASKMWERDHKGWATRNIKLRFSRKLLFAWGLLAAFSGELFPSEQLREAEDDDDADSYQTLLAELIREQTDVPPLELLAKASWHDGVSKETRAKLFESYDAFLIEFADSDKRAQLDAVAFSDASDDEGYQRIRKLSHEFREGIRQLFFDEHPKLKSLIRNFGVF